MMARESPKIELHQHKKVFLDSPFAVDKPRIPPRERKKKSNKICDLQAIAVEF